jgi:hypothetical protein
MLESYSGLVTCHPSLVTSAHDGVDDFFACEHRGLSVDVLCLNLAKGSTQMKRVRLGSAAIAAVKYDEEKRTLEVEFRDGDIYRYAHVPEFVYRELLKAESAGTFWNRVKDNYEFTPLDEANRKRQK